MPTLDDTQRTDLSIRILDRLVECGYIVHNPEYENQEFDVQDVIADTVEDFFGAPSGEAGA